MHPIAQLKQPGAPIVTGGGASIMDMATTICCYNAPEFLLTTAAYMDILRWLAIQ